MEDHSTAPTVSSQRGLTKPVTLEEIYHLNEDEENILLEMFIASLQLTLNPPAVSGFQKDKAKQKAHLDDVKNEVARYCVDVLPQLFLKYGVDADRIRCVLIIPQLISLNVYLDMRMLTVTILSGVRTRPYVIKVTGRCRTNIRANVCCHHYVGI